MFWALNGATRTPGAGQPPADAGRHDALAGVGRRPAHEQRAPHRADTLLAPIGLPPARVEPAHLDPAAARRHRAPPPPAAGVEEQPAARGPRAAAHAGQARRVGEQRHGVDRDGEADARAARPPATSRRQAPSSAAASRAAPAAAAWSRASASRSARARAATLRERREDAVQHEPQRARGLELVVARRPAPAPAHHAQPAAPARQVAGGLSSASVAGVSGSPAGDQSTLLAKSRHSAPPQSLIVSGRDIGRRYVLPLYSRKSVR